VKNEFGVWYIVVGVLLLIDMFNLLFMNGVLLFVCINFNVFLVGLIGFENLLWEFWLFVGY